MKKRVRIPTVNPAQVLSLAKRVKEKHVADGDASVLRTLNWKELAPLIDEAVEFHENAEQLKRKMLECYEKRAERIGRVVNFLRDSRDILTGNFRSEMKILGQWGYDVLEVRNNKPEEEPVVLKQIA